MLILKKAAERQPQPLAVGKKKQACVADRWGSAEIVR